MSKRTGFRAVGRVFVVLLLLLVLSAGVGVAVAQDYANPGRACPPQTGGDNPTKAYEHVDEDHPGFVRSVDGRTTALGAIGCLP